MTITEQVESVRPYYELGMDVGINITLTVLEEHCRSGVLQVDVDEVERWVADVRARMEEHRVD